MRRWFILLLIIGNLGGLAASPRTLSSVEFLNTNSYYQFGSYITFQTDIKAPGDIQEAFLFIQPAGGETRLVAVKVDSQGEISFRYDLTQNPLPPFATINYWFRAVMANGEEAVSQSNSFEYEDNRITWQTLEDEHFQVHWQDGNLAFGQAALNTAQKGLDSALAILPAPVSYPLKIYVYSSATALQEALQLGQLSWVAGHANPELGVILVSISPGSDQTMELERQLPHEMMHILQYIVAGSSYQKLPFWLAEGMASLAELYPNADYQRMLDRAISQKNLIPMESLCTSRPNEASSAFLAYAESASFVRYLHQNFGSSGLVSLMDQYRNGLGCLEGVQAAFGEPLSEIETRWRQESLRVDVARLALANLSPYLVLLALIILVPLLASIMVRQRKQKTA